MPNTCTCLGYQFCRKVAKTGHKLELVPFLPYPEVRIAEDVQRGGEADEFHVPKSVQCCINLVGKANFPPRIAFSTVGFQQSIGLDFPSCLGISFLGTLCCCISLDIVLLKPVEHHPRVGIICCQGGGYIIKPSPKSFCAGTASICCLEHRYAYPPTKVSQLWPCACTVGGAQCGTLSPQVACDRKFAVPVDPLPRVKPRVAEASDVIYHSTRSGAKDGKAAVGSEGAPTPMGMEREPTGNQL